MAEGLVLLCRWKLKMKVLPSVRDFKMKAALSLVVVVALIANCLNHIKCDEEDAVFKGFFDECLKEHQISLETFESFMKDDDYVPADYSVMCWLSCVMNNLGMMKEGKINCEHCRNMTKQDLTSEEDRAKVDKSDEIRQAEVPQDEKDECPLAFSATFCKIKNWNELGLPERSMEL